ncbi:UNVERIFIED_CONTAM: long-chain fatty acid--CoA ligase [Kocuria sp. CPCC 205316]|uniref:long-chain-fatty-acid--CoA ligase n=1 Tax=Kocuria TaxID=57493 RepID=UPI0036DB29A5
MTNLATLLTDTAAASPRSRAVVLDDKVLTYGALDDLSARVASMLAAAGIGPGDRVAMILPNVPHMPIAYYGILRTGGVVVPLNPLLSPRELAYHFENAEVSLVLVWEAMAEATRAAVAELDRDVRVVEVSAAGTLQALGEVPPRPDVADRDDDEPAVLLYTSGTTGRPKGAVLTHHNLRTNAELSASLFDLAPGDVMFGALPFFHVFGQTVALNGVVQAGATVTLLPRFDPAKALEILARDEVTVFAGVPSMYVALLAAADGGPVELPHLRAGVSGGSPLPVEVLERFEKVFGAPIYEGYGLSETSPVVCFNQKDRGRRPGSIGTVVRGAQLKVVDDLGEEVPVGEIGELVVAGEYVMAGYWRNPEATEAAIRDGWFSTGDLARVDEDGFYYIVDRKKDMVLRGGYNVYPREVEEVIYQFPGIAEAAVVGVPDEAMGEEVAAVVAFRDVPEAEQDAKVDELDAFVRERVARYKHPRYYKVVDELPKGPTGKILKRSLDLEGAGRRG